MVNPSSNNAPSAAQYYVVEGVRAAASGISALAGGYGIGSIANQMLHFLACERSRDSNGYCRYNSDKFSFHEPAVILMAFTSAVCAYETVSFLFRKHVTAPAVVKAPEKVPSSNPSVSAAATAPVVASDKPSVQTRVTAINTVNAGTTAPAKRHPTVNAPKLVK